ncbi:hypothetical protein [Rhodococcoides fascians]|nr:hypothetical protein [Rhodococcus fascians]
MRNEHYRPSGLDMLLDALYVPWYTVTTIAARGVLRLLGGHR